MSSVTWTRVRERAGAFRFVGVGNQLRRESRTWWVTRRWWVQALIWGVATNGLLAMMLWVFPHVEGLGDAADLTVAETAAQFAPVAAALVSIGTVVLSQGVLIDERRSGVLAWMLSKPLSRSGLLTAKAAGQAGGLLATLVLAPWLGVYLQLSLARQAWWPVGQWLGAIALVAVLVLLNLVLVLAISAVTWSRSLVLALPLAGILGADLVVAAVPALVDWMPWSLGRAAGTVLGSGMLVGGGPLLAALTLGAVCTGVAAWGLNETEV